MIALFDFSWLPACIDLYINAGWFVLTFVLRAFDALLGSSSTIPTTYFFDYHKLMMDGTKFDTIVEALVTLVTSLKQQQLHSYFAALISTYYTVVMTYVTFAFSASILYATSTGVNWIVRQCGLVLYMLYVYPVEYALQSFQSVWMECKQKITRWIEWFHTYAATHPQPVQEVHDHLE